MAAGRRGKPPRGRPPAGASRGASHAVPSRDASPAVAVAAPRSARALEWLALALVLAGVVVLYVPALGTQFFADDFLFLDQVRGRSLWQALLAPDPLSNFFRPVSRQLYFWIVAGLTHE